MDIHPILGSPILRTSSNPKYLPKILPLLTNTTMWGAELQQMNWMEAQTTIAASMTVSTPPPQLLREVHYCNTNRNLPSPVLPPSSTLLRVCVGDRALGKGCELRPVTVSQSQIYSTTWCLVANVSAAGDQLHSCPAFLSALLPQ